MSISLATKRYKLSKDILNHYYLVGQYAFGVLYKKMKDPNKAYKLVNSNNSSCFYIVSPSAKEPGRIQATCFYNDIPYSDFIRDKMTEVVNDLSTMGYTTITETV